MYVHLTSFGGVPRQIVRDNLKAGVLKANWHEPGLNPTYQDVATHYGTAILPARPRDKAKVEVGVQVVERWILARLRDQRFFALAELNSPKLTLLADLNDRPIRPRLTRPSRLGVSRRQLVDELDRPALASLPVEPYVQAEWRQRRVALDYHVDGHCYPVPHRLLRQQVEARITERTVELFHKGERVACHLLGGACGRHTTVTEHMPSSHRRHAGWIHERIQREATAIGAATATLVDVVLRGRPHPEQGFRACLGILRLARHYGVERLEAACKRGLEIGARSYGLINSILQNGLDRQPIARPPSDPTGSSPAGHRAIQPAAHRQAAPCQAPPARHHRGRRLSRCARPRSIAVPAARRRRLDRGAAEPHHKAPPASANRGSPAHSATRPVATTAPSSISASPSSSPELALARGDGRYRRLMKRLGKVRLLILDDWGLEPFGPEQRRDLLEIVEERYGHGATLITSQIPSIGGTTSSVRRPSPTPSSTASSTTPTDSSSRATRCDRLTMQLV
jgi:transposase